MASSTQMSTTSTQKFLLLRICGTGRMGHQDQWAAVGAGTAAGFRAARRSKAVDACSWGWTHASKAVFCPALPAVSRGSCAAPGLAPAARAHLRDEALEPHVVALEVRGDLVHLLVDVVDHGVLLVQLLLHAARHVAKRGDALLDAVQLRVLLALGVIPLALKLLRLARAVVVALARLAVQRVDDDRVLLAARGAGAGRRALRGRSRGAWADGVRQGPGPCDGS